MAQRHRRWIDRLALETSAELNDMWRSVDLADVRGSWARQVPRAATLIAGQQILAARRTDRYVREVLEEQNIDPSGPRLLPAGFAGLSFPMHSGDPAVPLEFSVSSPAFSTLRYIGQGHDPERAHAAGSINLAVRSQNAIADAGRQVSGVSQTTRKTRVLQVRVIAAGACDRCIILAGRLYRDASFERHPACNCTALPTSTDLAEELATDPYAFFNSLSEEEQNRRFGRSNARAIRDGADIFQVTNARMEQFRTESGQRQTRAGTTSRGYAGQLSRSRGPVSYTPDGRPQYEGRLTPDQIYRTAGSQPRAEALLERHGYITSSGQAPGGVLASPLSEAHESIHRY